MGFMDILKDVGGSLISSVPIVGPAVSNALGLSMSNNELAKTIQSMGSDWVMNEIIGKPNAQGQYSFNSAEAALQRAFESGEATKAFDRESDIYKRRYQITMADMKAAGLNPILALAGGGMQVGTGINAPMAHGTSASGSQAISPYGAGSNSALGFAKANEAESGSKEKLAHVAKMKKEVDLLIEKAKTEGGQQAALAQQVEESIARVSQIGQTIAKIKAETGESRMRTTQLEALAKKLAAEINTLNAKLPEFERTGEVYSGASGKVFAYLKEVMKIIGLPLSFLGGGAILKKSWKTRKDSQGKTEIYEDYLK